MGKNPYSKEREYYCNDTEEKVTGDRYLNTIHWRKMRQKVYDKYKGICQKCGDSIYLEDANIHHRTYKHMGNEEITDLILYCSSCHSKIHKHHRKQIRKFGHNLSDFIHQLTYSEKEEAYEVLVNHFHIECDLERDLENDINCIKHEIRNLRKRLNKLEREKEGQNEH